MHARYGGECIPNYVISKCDGASDVLEVVLLLREAGLYRATDAHLGCNVIPLFETIADLTRESLTVVGLAVILFWIDGIPRPDHLGRMAGRSVPLIERWRELNQLEPDVDKARFLFVAHIHAREVTTSENRPASLTSGITMLARNTMAARGCTTPALPTHSAPASARGRR